MNWINTLGPAQWLLLAAIPPAVLSLYFLKLKRQDMPVSSTLLWRKTIEDLHVNSIWQRLRQNILLYLQLLFLLLIILACLRPGWSGVNRMGERRIYIIDNSASMQATDSQPSRLEQAKAKVRELLSDTSSDDVGMVIAFSDRADVRQGFTTDRKRLLAAVDSIEPTSHATDAREALRAAAGLANPGRSSWNDQQDVQVAEAVPATAYILTDGAIGDLGEFEYGQLKLEYVRIGEPQTANLGIVGFSVQRSEEKPEDLETFARIVNNGDEQVEFTASLYLDDTLVDANTATIDGNREAGVRFELKGVERGSLKLEIDYKDALDIDNVAYAAIRPNRQISVMLITPGNSALETALKTSRVEQIASVRVESPNFMSDPEYSTSTNDSNFDLIIYDQCSPPKMPLSNTLFIGSIPPADISAAAVASSASPIAADANATEPNAAEVNNSKAVDNTNLKWQFGEPTGPVLVMDVNRSNTITQFLEMASVGIVEARTVTPPETGSVLMTGDIGPIMSVGPRGPYQDAVLGFSIVQSTAEGVGVNTDWGIKRSFPVFVYSAIEYLGGGITEASAPSVQPGWPIGLTLSNRFKDYTVVAPDGKKTAIERTNEGRFIYTQTDVPGVYSVNAAGIEQPVEMFCSNLFSTSESNLALGENIQVGAEKVAVTDTTIRARQELWRWLLMLGLGLLMLEWIVFNKRIFM